MNGAGSTASAALVAAGCFAALTVALLVADQLPGETATLRALHVGDGRLRTVATWISDATGSLPVVVLTGLAAAVLSLRRRFRDAARLAGAVAVTVAVGPLLKAAVERPRPTGWPLPGDISPYAYPSGHTAASTALVLALMVVQRVRLPWLGVAAVFVLVVAAAQLVLARHHPADLVAGWLLAVVCVGCAEAVRRRAGPGTMDA